MKDQLQQFDFEVTAIGGSVNAEDGVIEGVSVITSGVEAVGHNLEVDGTTLQQMHDLGVGAGKVPVKWNHRTGADAVNGYFTNFRIIGTKLKADWHLLKSHPQYNHALELADRMPQNVGFSASFFGISELEDGTKVFPPDEETKTHHTIGKGGVKIPVAAGVKVFARCSKLASVDLVASPAANPDGMFEAKPVDSAPHGMADKPTPGGKPEETKDAATLLLERFTQFEDGVNQRFDSFEQRFEALEEEDEEEEEHEEEEEETPDASEFGSVGEVLQYFEARLDAAANDRERQEFEAAVDKLGHDFETLKGVNEQLLEENRVLAEAYSELSAKTEQKVEFSAGSEGRRKATVVSAGGKELTEFEKRVEELKAEGKPVHEALTFAVNEDIERYQTHLQAKGAIQL